MATQVVRSLGEHLPTVRESHESKLTVWRFPLSFSQSRLGGRDRPSNACTIIGLKLAEYFITERIQDIQTDGNYRSLAVVLGNAIIDGNLVHEKECRERRLHSGNKNFTIPAAIYALKSTFAEHEFLAHKGSLASYLSHYVARGVSYWEDQRTRRYSAGRSRSTDRRAAKNGLKKTNSCPNLVDEASAGSSEKAISQTQLMLLLISEERTVLLVYLPKPSSKLVVMDPHAHGSHGAVIAFAEYRHLHEFCRWIATNLFSGELPSGFEISLILHKSHAGYADAHRRQQKPTYAKEKSYKFLQDGKSKL